MSYARNHRDDNEPVLLKTAAKLGAVWFEAPPLDGWIGWRGRFYPVEIKNPDGLNKFRERQLDFIKRCKLKGLPVFVWREERDVLDSLGARRSA